MSVTVTLTAMRGDVTLKREFTCDTLDAAIGLMGQIERDGADEGGVAALDVRAAPCDVLRNTLVDTGRVRGLTVSPESGGAVLMVEIGAETTSWMVTQFEPATERGGCRILDWGQGEGPVEAEYAALCQRVGSAWRSLVGHCAWVTIGPLVNERRRNEVDGLYGVPSRPRWLADRCGWAAAPLAEAGEGIDADFEVGLYRGLNWALGSVHQARNVRLPGDVDYALLQSLTAISCRESKSETGLTRHTFEQEGDGVFLRLLARSRVVERHLSLQAGEGA